MFSLINIYTKHVSTIHTHYYFSNMIWWVGSRRVAAPGTVDRITRDEVKCDPVVPGEGMRRDPSYQIKLPK